MPKRRRELGDDVDDDDNDDLQTVPNTSLQFHPLSFLIPKQFVVPLSLPYDANIPADSITFSQDEINDRVDQVFHSGLLDSEIWKSEDQDLKFVKFKKPYSADKNSEVDNADSLFLGIDDSDAIMLQNINPVTKKDYFRRNLKTEKFDLILKSQNDNELIEKIQNLIDIDFNETYIPEDKDKKSSDSSTEILESNQKPEFLYDNLVNQSVLLSLVGEEFKQIVTKLHDEESNVPDEQDEALFDIYTVIFSDKMSMVRPETLSSIQSKLSDLIINNTHTSIDSTIFTWLFEICLHIIKESFPIQWETIFESGDIYNSDEYQRFAETVMQACSIVVNIYANKLIDKNFKHEQGITSVVDFICSFGSVLKSLYRLEDFIELPDFFIPVVKHFYSLVSDFYKNMGHLTLDESCITRLEYISFDLIFIDIISSKIRMNLNIALEEMRSAFAKLIINVYLNYEDQRTFILNEIIDNIHCLDSLKSKAKNYRLDCGIPVQLVSFLIISLIQCHSDYGQDFDFKQWDYLLSNHSTKAKRIQLQEINDNYWKSVTLQYRLMSKATENFVTSFYNKLISTYSTNLRKIVENIFADLLIMLELPEFPGASIMLNLMLTIALSICSTKEESLTGSHALLFEIIGIIGSKILNLKSNIGIYELNTEIDPESFKETSKNYLTILSYFRFRNDDYCSGDNFINFISIIFLTKLKKIEDELNALISSEKNPLLGDKLELKKTLLKYVTSTISEVMELPYLTTSKIDLETLSDVRINEIYKRIVASQDISGRYHDILSFILTSLNNPKVKHRTLAIKNLTLLIDREPALLEDKSLRNMIKHRLGESYASVIDSVLDFLSKVLEIRPEYIIEYYDIVSTRISDSSINVKKKVINLIRFMFFKSDDIKVKIRVCQALLSQLDDENDRIIDLSCYTLCELLFLDIGYNANDGYSSDPVNIQNKSDDVIFVLCGLFYDSADVWALFERFFNERIIYSGVFNKKFRKELRIALNLLVETMLELITDTSGGVPENKRVDIESIMGVLSTFVKFDESLISQDQLITIQPYIINDYLSNNVCFYSLEILNLSLNNHKVLNKIFMQTCKESLMKRLTKFNAKELDRAIQCIWKLFLVDNDTSSVSKACVSSLRMLLKYIGALQRSISGFKPNSAVGRLLFLVGDFGRYCNFERDRDIFVNAKLGLQDKEPISVFLLKYVLKFCDSGLNKSLRKIAIKNAFNICISHPKLFFCVPVTKLIESSFRKKDLSIINVVVGSFLTLLENEEMEMIKKNGLDIKRSGSIKLDIAVFHGYSLDYVNDGICSILVQKYLPNILQTCLEKDGEIAVNSVEFLRMVVKFGFSNPKVCFPTIVALECAKSGHIRHIALELHRFLFEKYETLIESTYVESVKTAVKYSTNIYKVSELTECESFLKLFFNIVKERGSRQKIEKFLQSILRIFSNVNMYKFQKMKKDDLTDIQNQIIFLCITINEVEFSTQAELLMVITYIEKVILREEGLFGDQFNLLMDIFNDEEEEEGKLQYLVMSRILISLNCLVKCVTHNYSISPELILRFQESTDKKEFRTTIYRNEATKFFFGEIKELLTNDATNQLTLLREKLSEFGKTE